MAYAMYLRKSRKDEELEQQGAGETISRHREALFSLASLHGLHVEKIYQEIGSADTIDGRPAMRQLLEDVQNNKWQGVLVHDISRLARGDTMDQGIVAKVFRYSNPPTLIITPDKIYDPTNPADEDFFELSLMLARFEYKATTRRLQAGREASASEGKWQSRPPYGYEKYKLKGQKGWSLQIVPDEAKIVRLIYELYVHGLSTEKDGKPAHQSIGINRIVHVINGLGCRTKSGNPWTVSAIRTVLHNPTYCGLVRWNNRKKTVHITDGKRTTRRELCNDPILVPGVHEPIIPEDLWQAAQVSYMAHPKYHTKRDTTIMNPLAGLLYCGQCGHTMRRTPMYNHLANTPYVKCHTIGCPTVGMSLEAVEGLILQTLADWVRMDELGELGSAPDVPAADPSIALRSAAQQRLDDLEKRRLRLMDLLEDGVYDTATYAQRSALLAAETDAVKKELAAIPAHQPTKLECIRSAVPHIRNVLQLYDSSPAAEDKNRLLRSVVDRVVYHKDHACLRNENPLDFLTLDVYPVYFSPEK